MSSYNHLLCKISRDLRKKRVGFFFKKSPESSKDHGNILSESARDNGMLVSSDGRSFSVFLRFSFRIIAVTILRDVQPMSSFCLIRFHPFLGLFVSKRGRFS